jgi:hypothetical protein
LLAGHLRPGHRPFFHREDRFTGLAVEEEEKAHLGGLRDGRDIPTVLANGDQAGLGGKIIIPDVVVHDLVMPDQLAAGST